MIMKTLQHSIQAREPIRLLNFQNGTDVKYITSLSVFMLCGPAFNLSQKVFYILVKATEENIVCSPLSLETWPRKCKTNYHLPFPLHALKSKGETVSYYYKNKKRNQVEPPKGYMLVPFYFDPSKIHPRPLHRKTPGALSSQNSMGKAGSPPSLPSHTLGSL